MEARNSIEDAVVEALDLVANETVPNESCTCHWIIHPLLEATGYKKTEILPQATDVNGQYPDVTLMPDTEFTWYLEAKALNVRLIDQHVTQSLNYANQNGRRWVVLTNGREWRLYDNHIQGRAEDKQVLSILLDDRPLSVDFLEAIGRESITKNRLPDFVANHRLVQILTTQFKDVEGPVVQAVFRAVKRQPGLESISKQQVSQVLGEFKWSIESIAPDQPVMTVSEPARSESEPRKEGAADSISLNTIDLDVTVKGRKPELVIFPDTTSVPVKSWAALTIEVVQWLANTNRLPSVPYPAKSKKRYFLNSEPNHADAAIKGSFKRLSSSNSPVYVDTARSAIYLLMTIKKLLRNSGIDPSSVSFYLANQKD